LLLLLLLLDPRPAAAAAAVAVVRSPAVTKLAPLAVLMLVLLLCVHVPYCSWLHCRRRCCCCSCC
jgi:hypothetical protein